MYIDTHSHLQFSEFDEDRAMVIGNAKKAGVKQFIVPGVDSHSSVGAVHLATIHPDVIYAAIGFHPYEAQTTDSVQALETMLTTQDKHIVAIGECGLDYHIYNKEDATSKKDHQKRLFAAHITLALKYDLPLIMHCRDAYEDFFDVIDSMPTLPRGVIHCFSGGLQELRFAQDRNLYVGIDGNVTYSKQLGMIVPSIPKTMLLLETDAPYLTPVPNRGKRNEPKYIPLTADFIATLQNISIQDIASHTTQNAQTLFRLG